MRKWLNDSPLWSTFLAKEQEVKVSLLTNSKFFLPGDFMSVFSFALRDGGIADSNFDTLNLLSLKKSEK